MVRYAWKLPLLTFLPVLALGAPHNSSSTPAQGTVPVMETGNVSGATWSSMTSHLPTNAVESTINGAATPSNGFVSAISGVSAQPTQNSFGQWVVPGTGTFAKKSVFTFTGTGLAADLSASSYQVNDQSGGAPYNHLFEPTNVAVSDGFLNLKVPGGQRPSSEIPISSAEVTTNVKMLHGSVRTNAIFSTVPGTCHGNFFYHSDQQEIDIEYVTNTSSLSNPAAQGLNQPPWLHYTNQAVVEGGQSTHATGPAPANVAALHEYRVDWTADKTMFFLDDVLQKTFRTNIPTTAGPWIWNNWANGNPGWSDGPPEHDNVFKIKSITMYYDVPDESC